MSKRNPDKPCPLAVPWVTEESRKTKQNEEKILTYTHFILGINSGVI